MMIDFREISFTLSYSDGTNTKFTKVIAGDNDMVQWTTEQLAEVNSCGVVASYKDEQIAISGNVQN